ncbi:MAG: exosortase-associated EpsI family protein [Methanophagales archaeon]|nr:exosortase-associated EpsI family protein [Methanophagales archaeon]
MRSTYRITIGILILMIILSVFLSTPGMVSPGGVSLVATEVQHSSGDEIFVRTKLDFAHPETMAEFPQRIGEWHSVSYNWSALKESLGADILLSRAYRHPNSSKPVFFLIIQGTNMSTFHPPIVCYPALGYEIEEEGKVEVPIANASWAAGPWRSEREGSVFKGEMSVKKLVLVKRSGDGKITERRVALYYYVKDERMSMPNEITMIRLSAIAPLNGSYQEELEQMKKLASDTFPAMFEVRPEERMIAEKLIIKHGVAGFLVIAALVSLPIIFILMPSIRKKRKIEI